MVISQSGGKQRVKQFWLVQFWTQDLLILHFQSTFKPLRKCVPSSYLNRVNYKAKHENKLEVAFCENVCVFMCSLQSWKVCLCIMALMCAPDHLPAILLIQLAFCTHLLYYYVLLKMSHVPDVQIKNATTLNI